MEHFTTPGSQNDYFVLFHGTGGNEHSLLTVTGEVNPDASIISFLGNEGSGEERRYFKPLVNGNLDRDNYNENVEQFLAKWDAMKPKGASVTFIGYSNGANFILGLLEKRPDLAEKVLLLHPANLGYTFESESNTKIFVTAGATDSLVKPGDALQLSKQLEKHFPSTIFQLLDTGHELTEEEIHIAKDFYESVE